MERWLAEPGRRENVHCLVAAGGDGTIADLFNRFPDTTLGILPLGTENLLARHLRIPKSGTEAAEIIARGQFRTLDLCLLGERRFALMASAGFDADVVHRVHAARRGHISRTTYLKPILESLRRYEYPPIRIQVDDRAERWDARLAVVVNVPAYALRLPVAPRACDHDGCVDLRLFERGSTFQMLRYFCKVALGRHERLPDVLSISAKTVRLEAPVPVPIQVDGDPAGWTPAEIRVLPAALRVLAPAREM
jgi:YegS/Rv2252/BmrU family lipid kinase